MLEIEICKSFIFNKSILPFWLAECGLFAQKVVDLYKDPKCAENSDLQCMPKRLVDR